MDNPRPEKVAVVDEVRERFSDADAVAAHRVPRHRRSASSPTLRRALREAGGEYKVYKNTLVRFAARDLGLDLDEQLTGPTAIAFVPTGSGGDPVAVAKALRDFAKANPNLVVKGGVLGDKLLTADGRQGPRRRRSPRGAARQAGRRSWPPRCVQFAGLLQAVPAQLRLRPPGPHRRRAAPPAPPPSTRGPCRPRPRPPRPPPTHPPRRRRPTRPPPPRPRPPPTTETPAASADADAATDDDAPADDAAAENQEN